MTPHPDKQKKPTASQQDVLLFSFLPLLLGFTSFALSVIDDGGLPGVLL